MNTVLRGLVWIVIIVPAIYLVIIWKQIPQTVPMHFDIKGNVDSYGTRNDLLKLVLGLTVLNAVVYLILTNIYKIDPKKYAALNKDRLQRIAFYVSLYLAAIWVALIYQIVHNDVSHMMKFVFIAMACYLHCSETTCITSNQIILQVCVYPGRLKMKRTGEKRINWQGDFGFLVGYLLPFSFSY